MLNQISGYKLYLQFILFLFIVAVIGFLVDEILIFLCLGQLFILIWHYKQLIKLSHWLWVNRSFIPPQAKGSWENIFNGIFRMQKKNRKKHKQLLSVIHRFRQGAEALPDAAVVLDSQYNILWCNRLAQALLGLVWPQDNGQRIDNLLRHPEFLTYLEKGQFCSALDIPSPTNSESILELRLIQYGENQLLLIARDITRIHQLEIIRKDFVANVSHELKTPLTVLQGYLEVMQSMEDGYTEKEKPLYFMQQQTYRMKLLVEQLLVLSHIEESADVSYLKRVNMQTMKTNLMEEAKVLSNNQHQITFNWDDKLDIYGDAVQIRSACSNLIANAIRYTEKSGAIHIGWEKIGSGAKFYVNDTGIGIGAAHVPRITERFYRADAARSRHTGGSGLGLAIVKHVLNNHSSELMVESRINKGSEFSFIIPLKLVN